MNNKTIFLFFDLLRAGLWEQPVNLARYIPIDFDGLYQLAEEQSVIGLVAAGLEHVADVRLTKPMVLPFLKKVVGLENRNQAMDAFIRDIILRLRRASIYSLLVKGQGIAQCYSRPQWRTSGDIDLFLDAQNYVKAKELLIPLSSSVEEENAIVKHLGMTIDSWTVELHGTLSCSLSPRMDRVISEVQNDTFFNGNVRIWWNKEVDIYIPNPDNDIIFVFTHIIKHFFKGGIGLRQICDWCRFLFTFSGQIDSSLLNTRLNRMGLLSEWKAFSAFAVEYLAMPISSIPLYSSDKRWKRKAQRINSFVMTVGNFGQNRDVSYYDKYPFLIRKTISFWRRTSDAFIYFTIFPVDSTCFYLRTLIKGFSAAAKGIG